MQEGDVLPHLEREEHFCGSYRTPKCGMTYFRTCREEATLQLPGAAKTYRSVHAAHAPIDSFQKKKKSMIISVFNILRQMYAYYSSQ